MRSNADIIRSIYDSFNKGNLEGIFAILDPAMQLIDVGLGRTFHGRDGFLEWLDPWEKGAPDGKAFLKSLIHQGDLVAVEHSHRGTHTGPFATPMGVIPASGRAMEVQFCEVFELKNGMIAVWRNYWDLWGFLQQLGVSPTLAR